MNLLILILIVISGVFAQAASPTFTAPTPVSASVMVDPTTHVILFPADFATANGLGSGGGGEANLGSNLGTGAKLFAQKSGITLQFNTLAVSSSMSLSSNNNTLSLDLDSDLDALAALSGTGILQRTGANTFSFVTIGANLSYSGGTLSATGGGGGALVGTVLASGSFSVNELLGSADASGTNAHPTGVTASGGTLTATTLNAGTVNITNPLANVAMTGGTESGRTNTDLNASVVMASDANKRPTSSTLTLAEANALHGVTPLTSANIDDNAYNASSWDADTIHAPSKNAVRDKVELLAPLISPSFTTPTLGAATATTINKLTLTPPATGSTFTLADGKTLTVNQTTTLDRQNSTGLPIEFCVALSDETTALTTGTKVVTIRAPYAFTITSIRGSVNTVSSSGLPTVDIKESGTTIFSTKLTIDASELTSVTAAAPAVISDTAIADDAEITFDINTAGTGAKGLKVWIYGYR